MKFIDLSSCVVMAAFASVSVAEPLVFPIEETTPFPNNSIVLSEIDPSLPDLRLMLDFLEPGGGMTWTLYAPALVEDGVGMGNEPGPVQYDVEVADLGTGANNPYPVVAGDSIGGATSGWVYSMLTFTDSEPIMPIAWSGGPDDQNCLTCSTSSSRLPDGEVRYLPFRWKLIKDTDWVYGWIAMKTTMFHIQDCVNVCFPQPEITGVTFDFLALGIETSVNTPIIAGAGLCPADFNFDASLNFLDVSDFLALYGAGDYTADLNNDGSLNFLDVSAFLGFYSSDCGL